MTDELPKTGRYAKKAPTRGGARPGAGGKKPVSAATGFIRDLANRLVSSERITPLEVMLQAMYNAYDAEDWATAAGFAKDAAPYIHPKLQAIELTGKDGKDLATPAAPVIHLILNNSTQEKKP
jgi:hypothetical protein